MNPQENEYLFFNLEISGTTTGRGEPDLDFLTDISFLGASIPLVDELTTELDSQGICAETTEFLKPNSKISFLKESQSHSNSLDTIVSTDFE